jgi:DNA (cytosine-5)-methyltransferase 1
MNFLSLFSGIGGLDLGLERAGMWCVGQVEIDPYCRRVLAKHWPDVPRFEDVRTFSKELISEQIDLIAGGFPCQDISIAGNRGGLAGARSGLWGQMLRLVREVGPSFVLVENVGALLIPDGSGDAPIGTVLGDLASLGFDAEWSVLSACAMGAPHTRERVFIVAHAHEIGRGGFGICDERDDAICAGLKAWQTSPRGEWRDVERWIGEVVETGGGIVPSSERGRMVDGVPARLERIGAAGNAVVPQVAQWIGERIMSAARGEVAA